MQVGDLVRYTGSGDRLGMGVVLRIFFHEMKEGIHPAYNSAEVLWNGVTKWTVRQISWKYLEAVNESR